MEGFVEYKDFDGDLKGELDFDPRLESADLFLKVNKILMNFEII